MTTPAYYADFSPLPALFNLSRLVISFCGLGGLALNDAAVVGLAAAITAAVVIATFRQGNRRALWTISWLAATLALAAPFQDPSLRHNYLPLAGFWMTIAFLVAGAMETGAAEGRQQHRRIQSIVLSVAAIVVLVIEGSALQLEISDYRRHGDLHRELAEMLEVVEPHIPRHRPLLFVDRGRRRAVNETVHSVTGVEKSFFVREDAIWQLVFLPSLLNFLGDPFEAKLTPVAKDRVATVLGAEVTVLVFTDGGFYLADRLPDSVSRAVAATGRLPATVTLYDFQPN
jgi:hypothetical protein